jgi:hypothetical protein
MVRTKVALADSLCSKRVLNECLGIIAAEWLDSDVSEVFGRVAELNMHNAGCEFIIACFCLDTDENCCLSKL